MSIFNHKQDVQIQQVHDPILQNHDVELFIKREDLLHPQISGNKFRKLKYNLLKAQQLNHQKVITFGGAYSNHISATAYACFAMGFESIGIIRGEELSTNWQQNPTLNQANQNGMQLKFVSRKAYKTKHTDEFHAQLKAKFGRCFIVPEGGTNALAIKGCQEILTADDNQKFDTICVAVGTGGTLSGIVLSALPQQNIIGFSALKAASLTDEVTRYCQSKANKQAKWSINFDYTFGGYAKTNPQLMTFIEDFYKRHQILLEPIYTGKMLFGIFDLVKQGYFARGTKILAIHTGGLQGWQGFSANLESAMLKTALNQEKIICDA